MQEGNFIWNRKKNIKIELAVNRKLWVIAIFWPLRPFIYKDNKENKSHNFFLKLTARHTRKLQQLLFDTFGSLFFFLHVYTKTFYRTIQWTILLRLVRIGSVVLEKNITNWENLLDNFASLVLLTRKLLNQTFLFVKLKSSRRQFYGRQHDLVDCYGISASQITTDMFNLSKTLSGPFLVHDLSTGLYLD